jgi:2-polyprenyl-3-methyl-5-hydroxy-6-metoxy-1,4-benzoquinol methylase
MKLITFQEFDNIFQKNVANVFTFYNDTMQLETGQHNAGWLPGRIDLHQYVKSSAIRYYKIYCHLVENNVQSVCDVGGFFSAFPLTLHQLGFSVTMTEALKYYSESFTPLFNYVRSNGVTIVDYDPFEEPFHGNTTYDAVFALAVIEHYPHSLSFFLNNLKAMMHHNGIIVIDVPNIAYLRKRLRFLFGKTPLTHAATIYDSKIPFIGHHHEYTMEELLEVMNKANLNVVTKFYLNYSPSRIISVKNFLKNPVSSLLFMIFPNLRETIGVISKKR